MSNHRPQPFTLTNARTESGGVAVARFRCDACEAQYDITLGSGSLNPEHTVKRARREGWTCDADRIGARCPMCSAKRKRPPAPSPQPNPEPTPMAVAPTPTPAVITRALTYQQRSSIRTMLEAGFDEELGCYSKDVSDESIAKDLGVAVVLVREIREAAYGPIRITPETVELRRDIDALRRDFRAHMDAMQAFIARLDAIDARVGIKSPEKAA